MITQLLCDLFFWLADFFVGLLPTFPSFSGLRQSQGPTLAMIAEIGRFLDLRTLSVCLLLVLIVYNIRFVWSLIMWIVRKIPGVS